MGIFYSCFDDDNDYYDQRMEINISSRENIIKPSKSPQPSNYEELPPKSLQPSNYKQLPTKSPQPSNYEKLPPKSPQPSNYEKLPPESESVTNQNTEFPEVSVNSIVQRREDELVIFQKYIINNLLTNVNRTNKTFNDRKVYELETLDENSLEYQNIKEIYYTNKHSSCYNITSIQTIYNPYLLIQYTLKKMEFAKKGLKFEEKIMFHGTKLCNIDNICRNNFNWRKGTSDGHKFGHGISFSPCFYYASHYGDVGYMKVMLVAFVLVGACCEGKDTMLIPTQNCDTSVNSKNTVYVKYDDNTFYPKYLIQYYGHDPRCRKRRN